MGWNDHVDEADDDYARFLRVLVDREMLKDAALGITKLVIDKGPGVLSPKQSFVFNHDVIGVYVKDGCTRCSSDIPWSEMPESLDNGGLCNYCWHMSAKDD